MRIDYLLVQIKDIDYCRVLFKAELPNQNIIRAQNEITATLRLLGFKDYKVDWISKELDEQEKEGD